MVTINGGEVSLCQCSRRFLNTPCVPLVPVQWGDAHEAAVLDLRRCPDPKEGPGHLAGTCLLVPKGILHAQHPACHGTDSKYLFSLTSFPEFPNPFTLPSRTWLTFPERFFPFGPDRNLPKGAVLPFNPDASGPGPLTLLDSFYSSSL